MRDRETERDRVTERKGEKNTEVIKFRIYIEIFMRDK